MTIKIIFKERTSKKLMKSKHKCLECGAYLIKKNNHGAYYCPTPMDRCTSNDYKVTKMKEVILMNRTGIDQPSRRKNRMAYEERWQIE
jgi:ssDNA-binding Zn-finger/Zn-ribbon topoisomerase 1